jgi:glyoxalase family protein
MKIEGIHHVTAIAGDPQRNVDFYTDLLGLRLVKRTVNFDDPGTYHFYFGDRLGRPGTIMTFFPWARAVAGRSGSGMVGATAFSIPPSSLGYWIDRLVGLRISHNVAGGSSGGSTISLRDPDGLELELVADAEADAVEDVWSDGPVPAESAIRSFFGVTLCVEQPDESARILTDVFGMESADAPDDRIRFRAPGEAPGRVVDIKASDVRGRGGCGTVHHVAFRAHDDEEQRAWRELLASVGLQVTHVLDRQYFSSIYFREPGGVLFEIATDGPGFARDEPVDSLGTDLKLPAWLESRRNEIESILPPIEVSLNG